MALMKSERELIKALKEYLYGDKKEREEKERKKKEEEARKKEIENMRQEELRSLRRVLEEQEEQSYKDLREELDKSIAKWERIALLLEQAANEDEAIDEDKEQEVVHIPLEGHGQQMNAGVESESESEQQEVVVESCEEKVLADEGELVTGMVEEMICPNDGNVDINDQEGKDIVQRSDAKEKTIDDRDEVFADECDALEIYKQGEEQIVDQVDWYFYAGDVMIMTKVFIPRFKGGIQFEDWHQNVVWSGINSVIIVIPYNWKIRKKSQQFNGT